MPDQVRVVVESLPSDTISIFLNVLTGVLTPILLLLITIYMTRKSEERARRYSENIRLKDIRLEFLKEFHQASSDLFKSVQALRANNLKRLKYEKYASGNIENNDEIVSSGNVEAIKMNQDILKWQLDKMLDAETEHAILVINLVAAKVGVETLLSEEFTRKLSTKVDKIIEKCPEAGAITQEMTKDFINELKIITRVVESNPNQWISDLPL